MFYGKHCEIFYYLFSRNHLTFPLKYVILYIVNGTVTKYIIGGLHNEKY